MGKFRSKLKGQSKGKRWAKGQSSSSNPQTTKYRDQAKSRFFQENLGSSNLTTDALQKHNAINSFVAPKLPTEPSEMEMDSESAGTNTLQTMQSFASDWSACTNMSFNRLLNCFTPSSALHKEMLAILAAVTEVIKQNGGSETSTEYYAALMTTLEVTETEESLAAILSLLNMGLKSVPDSVLKLKFSASSKLFLELLNKHSQSNNNVILRSLLGILSHLLRVQEAASWSSPSIMHIFGPILAFTCHTKPKIRKAAQHGVCSILKGSKFMSEEAENPPTQHPGAIYVAQFCLKQIEACTGTAGQTTTLHTLTLLKDIIHTFPKAQIKSTCETILKIMTVNNPLINSCGMQVLYSLFSAPRVTVPANLNGQLISALYDYQPAPTDIQPTLAWIAVMQQAHVHLSDVDVAISCSTLPKIVKTLTQLWLLESNDVTSATTRALQVILEDCVAPACSTSDVAEQFASHLQKCFQTIELCLGYQYCRTWHQVLHVIAVMFKVAGKYCSQYLLNCLKQLAELRDSYKFSYNNELEYAVGAAIKSMGPNVVLEIIPLKKNDEEVNIDRSWLLPVIKENVQCATLEYFCKSILPLAMQCHRKSTQYNANNDGIRAHSYDLLYIQLWSLLPSFCRYPTDVTANFKTIAKILGTAISDRKELRSSVMASLRKLISCSQENGNKEDTAELSRFAKNYLPILFNLYTTKPNGTDEEGQRLAALDTAKVYLNIAPEDLRSQLFRNALERLKTVPEEDSFMRQSILDLIRALIDYQNSESISLLFEQYIKNLVDLKENKDQKKAYKLLEQICSSESEGCKEFFKENRKQLQSLLLRSLSSAAVTSKGARLRCLNYLIKSQPQLTHESKLVKSAATEAVLSCKDVNEKCRAAAYDLITTIGFTLESHQQLSQYVEILIAGLAGTPQMICCTILSLASLVHNFSGSLGQENLKNLLETVTQLIKTSIREIVGSCISFLKVYLTSLPSPMVATNLPNIVKSLSGMTDDCKRHFRLKVKHLLDRLVRKYGYDSIIQHVPQSDTVMYKRLNNLRKLNARKKRKKEEMQQEEERESEEDFTVKAKPRSMEDILADSDSDFESMELDKPRTARHKIDTWIQEDEENILDFTDPSAVSKITATKPGKLPTLPNEAQKKKKKDRGFKTAPDGRLIITDDTSDSDEEDKPLKKEKIKFDSDSESDLDTRSAAETAILGSKKRKRQDTESMHSGYTSQQPAMKYKAGGSGIHRPLKSSTASVYSNTGSEYRSKKAKGDVKRKGKPDPYAYVPLSRSSLNKRKRKKAAGQFKNIISGAKSGAKKGTKLGKKNKRKNV